MTKAEKNRRADLDTIGLLLPALTKKVGKKFVLEGPTPGGQYGIMLDERSLTLSMEPRDLRIYLMGMAKLFCVTHGINSILDFV